MSATEYVPIRVTTLRGGGSLTFNAYIRAAGKYHLYCKNGENLQGTLLEKLKEKRLKKMYIDPKDESAYRSFMTQSIESAYDKNSDVPIADRAEVVQGAQQAAAEEVMENPESEEAYNLAKMGTEKYIEFILQDWVLVELKS